MLCKIMNNPNVTTTNMNIDGREFVLAEVARGMGHIGVFRYISTAYNALDVLYVENEPIIKIFNPQVSNPHTDKHIAQISGSEKCAELIKLRLSASIENFYQYDQGLARSAVSALELLNPGLYVVHDSQMHPCDGAGNFFWNAYNVKKSVVGTCDKNITIGDANYSPGFLIPTKIAANYQPKKMYDLADKLKSGRRLGGVAYHVSGMFSALLEGHHTATACLIKDSDFRCLVIEPLSDVIYDAKDRRTKNRKISALSCPYVNIPIEELPESALERFLVTRRHVKPASFSIIKPKMTKFVRSVSNRVFPIVAYEKAEQLPGCAMVESASGINSITEEQLAALLEGEVKHNDEYIVSPNYFSSVVTASNYLQITDFNRFLTFAIDILKKDDLTPVHKYIAEHLLTVMHPTIHEYFASLIINEQENIEVPSSDTDESVVSNDETQDNAEALATEIDKSPAPKQKPEENQTHSVAHNVNEGIIIETARKYVVLWQDHNQKKQDDNESYRLRRQKSTANKMAVTEAKGIATLEMAVRSIGDMPRNP